MKTLQQALSEAEAERDRLDVVIGYLRAQLGDSPAPRRSRAPSAGTVAALAEQALQARGEPMSNGELAEAIRNLGGTVADGANVARVLKRHPRFVKTGRGEWGLA